MSQSSYKFADYSLYSGGGVSLDINDIHNMHNTYLQYYYLNNMSSPLCPALHVSYQQLKSIVEGVPVPVGVDPNSPRGVRFLLCLDSNYTFYLKMQVGFLALASSKDSLGNTQYTFNFIPYLFQYYLIYSGTNIIAVQGSFPTVADTNYFNNVYYQNGPGNGEPLNCAPTSFVRSLTYPWTFEIAEMAKANDKLNGGVLDLTQAGLAISLGCELTPDSTTGIYPQGLMFYLYDNNYAIPTGITPPDTGDLSKTFSTPPSGTSNNLYVSIFSGKGANYGNMCPPRCDNSYVAPTPLNSIIASFYKF